MNKKFLLILMFTLILSISAANAHDSIANDTGVYDNQITLENNVEIGNFTELNDEISKIPDGGNITLKKDYAYNFNDSDYKNGIVINKDNIVIDGDGHTIDGAGQARIFNITSNNVTLKNIHFINGYSNENGGAISSTSSLNILNSTFYNNSANKSGGALYIENSFSDCMINSTFINNSAYNGGAIYLNDRTTNNRIYGYFEGNDAERAGGAIYIKGDSSNNTIASEFYNNRANKASGGAIFFYNLAESNQFDSIFRSNFGIYGAGIFFYNKANNNRFNSDFRFNVAKSCGGAIFFHNTTNNNNLTGYFIKNTALRQVDEINGNGGAITFKDVSSNCIFTCDFINNTAAKNGGGINYRQTPYNITLNCNFINNTAHVGGGVNFFESFENVAFNGDFIDNYAIYGGAMALKNGAVENVSFINNSAECGGAVYFGSDGIITGCSFTNNTALRMGGSIYFNKTGTVNKSSFKKNNAHDGGAILACGNLKIDNSQLEENIATLKTNHISLKENATITLTNVSSQNIGPFFVSHLTIINVSNATYGNSIKITVNVSFNDIPINKGNVSVVINNKKYSSDVINGSATIEIPKINAGSYSCEVIFNGDANYTESTKNVSFKVVKQNIKVSAGNKAYVINYGGKYSVTVKDNNNKLASGIKATFILNGKTIGTATTNSKGVATITLTAKMLKTAKAGKKNLVIKTSNANYNTVSKTVKITINKEKTKITAKAKKFKKSLKTKKYTVTLKNSKGKAVKKVSVSLKVKGKTYYAKTNSKGKATFKITKLTKKGKFNAAITYKGSKYYQKATKKVSITIK